MADQPVVPIRAHPDDPLQASALMPPIAPGGADEQVWARALRDRDEAAFGRLLDRYFPAMLRLAMAHVGSRARAEEVVQDTWLAALAGVHRFDGRASLRTWVFRILLNRARSRGAREARVIPISGLPGGRTGGVPTGIAAVPAATAQPSPERDVFARELRTGIERAVASLPEGPRQVVTLRDVEGWSAAEVCAALGLTEGNQRELLHRARTRLRDALADYAFEPSDEANARAAGM